MSQAISTGCYRLDKVLGEGVSRGRLTLIYGAAETGKTTIAMQCALNTSRLGLKTLYIDSDSGFLPERLSQLASKDFLRLAESIIIARPLTFNEQEGIIEKLDKYVNKKFGLIVLDTVTSLYGLELLDKEKTFKLNRNLNQQIANLVQISRMLDLSVILVSQARNVEGESTVSPAATRVLRFWCPNVIMLLRIGKNQVVKANVEKINGINSETSVYLVIREDGVFDHQL